MRLVLTGILLSASVLWMAGKPWEAPSTQKPPPSARYLFSLKNQAISESSGVASSHLKPGVFWTHNDSGGKAEVYAFGSTGNDLGTFTLAGIQARDWEDMASAKIDGVACLYVGDIGDNMANQREVRIYRFREPKAQIPGGSIDEFMTYVVRYPDGAHNCETLMVSPAGDIYLVSKSEIGDSAVYVLAAPAKSGTYTLKRVGTIKLEAGNVYSHMITGGDISPDGSTVVIRTYFSILLYRSAKLQEFWKSTPVSLPVPMERQGESVCFDWENARLLTTSEGSPCRVSAVTLP
ncbi:MAG: hypothetical protein M3R13_00215 [Armatimonadota bacterium]|nr:hypothetical protein [Armatimonadota bacterium]